MIFFSELVHLVPNYFFKHQSWNLIRGFFKCMTLSSPICSVKGGEDVESLQLEMSGFLKELACPYSTLVSGEIKERLKKKEDCLKVLCKLPESFCLQFYR